VSSLESIEFYQGAHFVDKPHYSRNEQIMCPIEGGLSIMLVPHINRQEVYSGKLMEGFMKKSAFLEIIEKHIDPQPDNEKMSHYYDAKTTETEPGVYKHHAQDNVSPVNFWMPNMARYPMFANAHREAVHLAPGDCLFIPAFYYYHMQGFRQMKTGKSGILRSFPEEYFSKN
jgi:hypothetical protein